MTEVTQTADVEVRLLLVDDGSYADYISDTLNPAAVRWHCDQVVTLTAAVDRLAQTVYDVVLLDLALADSADLDGLATVMTVRPEVPVIILSGDDDDAVALRAVRAGAQDYVPKHEATAGVLVRMIRAAIERKRFELHINPVAYRDSLTQLPGRTILLESLDRALKGAHRKRDVVGLFFVDLDHFQQINDSFGHDAGDQVLRQVAKRLREALRAYDMVGRWSGDEFVAIVEVKRRAGLLPLAERLQHRLKAPFIIANRELFLTASIGISSHPVDGRDPEKLLRNADRAMYQAKAEGRDTYRFYTARHQHKVPSRVALATELRRAADRGELLLHFQPLVDLTTGHIDGLEALVRWQHPTMGFVPPAEFIPIAEESGLILAIERWVLESAMTQARAAFAADRLKLAINLSSKHFDHPEMPHELKTIMQAVGYDPRLLELELTERGLMHHPKRVLRHLKECDRLGIRVAVDDFGTGYSCLALMNSLPLHALKIDRLFVHNCAASATSQALVAAIIRMGHALGLRVTAEGVETIEQLEYLHAQQCDRAQGWLFSAPVPSFELATMVRDYTHLPAWRSR
jgi:diguanylate cyclase (GGDEF)-like protein